MLPFFWCGVELLCWSPLSCLVLCLLEGNLHKHKTGIYLLQVWRLKIFSFYADSKSISWWQPPYKFSLAKWALFGTDNTFVDMFMFTNSSEVLNEIHFFSWSTQSYSIQTLAISCCSSLHLLYCYIFGIFDWYLHLMSLSNCLIVFTLAFSSRVPLTWVILPTTPSLWWQFPLSLIQHLQMGT